MPFTNSDSDALMNETSGYKNVLEGEMFMRAFIPMKDFTAPGAYVSSTSWTVAPALPNGLVLSPMGVISGKVATMFKHLPQPPFVLPNDFGVVKPLPENGGDVEDAGALTKDAVDFKFVITHSYMYIDPSSGAPVPMVDVGNFTIKVLRNNAIGNYLWLKHYYASGWKVDDYNTPDEVVPNYPSNAFKKQ